MVEDFSVEDVVDNVECMMTALPFREHQLTQGRTKFLKSSERPIPSFKCEKRAIMGTQSRAIVFEQVRHFRTIDSG